MEELNKKLNIQQIIIVTQCFQHKAVKSTLEFFLFSKFGLYWAAFIFVKIHNRQIGIWIEQFFSKFSDGSAWEHLINQSS